MMKDILERIADSSANESSDELICRLRDCAREIEAMRAASDASARQLIDWLLTDPETGSRLTFAGPLESDFLRMSRVKMASADGAIWTLTAGLREGYLTASERLANIRKAAAEDDTEMQPVHIGADGQESFLAPSPAQPTPDYIDLQGLREKLLAPREIVRDEDGWLTHPDFPICDEDVRADKFLEAFRIESAFVGMEEDVDFETYDRYVESEEPNCSAWIPTPPAGNGWLLLEIYDTEDGPHALFGRDAYTAEQERKKEHTRKLRADMERIRADRAAAPLPPASSPAEQPRECVKRPTSVAAPLSEYHEDYGPVVWWAWEDGLWLGEPAWIGTPTDSDWPGYHTHWTFHPEFPARAEQPRECGEPSNDDCGCAPSLCADPIWYQCRDNHISECEERNVTWLGESETRLIVDAEHRMRNSGWPAHAEALQHARALLAACAATLGERHPDDAAVNRFAAAMREKMAKSRTKGRRGWSEPDECSAADLTHMLRQHVEKGDPVDVANFCMMLHQRGERIAAKGE